MPSKISFHIIINNISNNYISNMCVYDNSCDWKSSLTLEIVIVLFPSLPVSLAASLPKSLPAPFPMIRPSLPTMRPSLHTSFDVMPQSLADASCIPHECQFVLWNVLEKNLTG
jgi:hypothetical protein